MSDKYLNKEGLNRFLEKIKNKFAPIDSPNFKGKPTVETPEFEKTTTSKELVNKEYLSKMCDFIMNYIDSEKGAVSIKLNIKPEDWLESGNLLKCTKLENFMAFAEIDNGSVFVRIDSFRLSAENTLDAYKNHPISMAKDGVIYTIKEKPNYELPVIVDAIVSTDLTQFLGGI